MLSPADAALCARDAGLPALSWALDDERVLATLNGALPGAPLASVRSRYVRYKPGASCLVACTLAGRDGSLTQGAVRAFSPGMAGDKLSSASKREARTTTLGPGVLLFPELCSDIHIYPCDHELTALWRMTDAEQRRRLLLRCGIEDRALAEAEPLLLRYKPERRAVFRLRALDRSAAVKLYTREDFPRVMANAGAPGALSPRLLGVDEHARAVVWEWIDGRPPDLADPADVSLVAAALGELHGSTRTFTFEGHDRSTALVRQGEALSTLCPAAATDAAALAREVCAALPDESRAVPSHGDLAPDQMVIRGGTLLLLDFDRARPDHPAADAAQLLARIAYTDLVSGRPQRTEALAPGVMGAGGCADAQRGLRPLMAGALLSLATEPFRSRRPEWPAEIGAVLALARATLRHATLPR